MNLIFNQWQDTKLAVLTVSSETKKELGHKC